MQWLYEFGVAIWDWFGDEDHQNRVTAIAAALGVIFTGIGAILGVPWFILRRHLARSDTGDDSHTIPAPDLLSMDQHLTILEKREDQLKARLADAHQEEKDVLQRQIADLQTQIGNPEQSLAEARKRIADLERLLDREANHIGGDRINAAKAALEQGDYSLADAIFAEIEARNELTVQETARAAYGRGEVAEAEVRWQDAALHYADAARLDPGYDNLFKAREYAWRAGNFGAAHRYGTDLVAVARKEAKQEKIAEALNEHALTLQAQGRSEEAEGHLRAALEIDRTTIGAAHPDYATHLNNLGLVLRAEGRLAGAEKLYREALKIGRATIGKGHPVYATRLNNLASAVQAQGRYEEAEGLYREVLEITLSTMGERHPEHAMGLGNLGKLLGQTGRVDEGREMLEKALTIFRAALPPDHPHIAETQRRLAALPGD